MYNILVIGAGHAGVEAACLDRSVPPAYNACGVEWVFVKQTLYRHANHQRLSRLL